MITLRQLLKEYLELDDPSIISLLDKIREEWTPFFEELQDDIFNGSIDPNQKLDILLGTQVEQRA